MTQNYNPLPVFTRSAGQLIATIDQTTSGVSNGVAVNAPLPAGTNLLGKFGIDQTTPGFTNGVQINAALPTGTNSIGNVGLNAGNNLVGKFGIDQTTAGVSNGVQITGPGTLSSNTLFTSPIGIFNTSAPTLTNGQVAQFQLDTNGNLLTHLNVSLPTGANVIGGVNISQTNPGVTNGVQITGPGTASGNALFAEVMGTFNTSAPTLTNGQSSVLQTDASANLKVNLATSVPTGTNSIGTVGLNAGTNIVGNFRIDQTSAGVTNGIQITGPGTSSANPIFVNTGAGTSGVVKNSGQLVPGTQPIAAGGTSFATIQAALITTGKVASLEHVVMSASTVCQFDVQYIPNGGGSPTTVYTFFSGGPYGHADFQASPVGGELTLPSADGTNARFQFVVTNTDPTNTAYAYITATWIEN